jgi:hypothetical protein
MSKLPRKKEYMRLNIFRSYSITMLSLRKVFEKYQSILNILVLEQDEKFF